MWKIDRKIRTKIGERPVQLNIIYDDKIKKIKKYYILGFEGELFVRVPNGKSDDDLIKFLNHPYHVKWFDKAETDCCSEKEKAEEEIKTIGKLENRTVEELRNIIRKYVDKYSSKFGKPKKIVIRTIYGLWGRCNQNKDILTFTPGMKYLPEKYIEHLVYHEMIHMYCLNHNPPFYREMVKVYPDWKKWEYELSLYEYKIIKEKNILF